MKKRSVKEIMRRWAVISSVVITLFFIWDIVQFVLYLTSLTPDLIHQFLFPAILEFVTNNLLRAVLIYVPLFYLVFSKNNKSIFFKMWARISTVLFSAIFVSDYVKSYFYGRWTLVVDLIQLIALVPLYYFAWNLSKSYNKLNK
jgi:hypothetical protein